MKLLRRPSMWGLLIAVVLLGTPVIAADVEWESSHTFQASEASRFRIRESIRVAGEDSSPTEEEESADEDESEENEPAPKPVAVVQAQAEQLSERFDLYYGKLDGIVTKLTERLGLMAVQGKDVTAAEATLSTAKAQLKQCQAISGQAVTGLQSLTIVTYVKNPEVMVESRDDAFEARGCFQGVIDGLKETVRLMKTAA